MLDPRAQHLLKTLIERYIAEGQPVGSRVLSRQSGLELSPATIRNVMADLEDMGFIASPHTSAGRIPTPKGYRLFVDSLLIIKPLEEAEVSELQEQLQADRPQLLVNAAAQMLSQLTHYAGVVATPRRRDASFRHIEFLRLSERRVLLIIVTAEGDVQNRILHTDRGYGQAQLLEAHGRHVHAAARQDVVEGAGLTFLAGDAGVLGEVAEVAPPEHDAGGGRRLAPEHLEQARLARPVAPHQAHLVAGAHGERRLADHETATHLNAHIADLQHPSMIGGRRRR